MRRSRAWSHDRDDRRDRDRDRQRDRDRSRDQNRHRDRDRDRDRRRDRDRDDHHRRRDISPETDHAKESSDAPQTDRMAAAEPDFSGPTAVQVCNMLCEMCTSRVPLQVLGQCFAPEVRVALLSSGSVVARGGAKVAAAIAAAPVGHAKPSKTLYVEAVRAHVPSCNAF